MSDEPSLTRWSFQDFKLFYDAKFGRKREVVEPKDKLTVENGNGSYSSAAAAENGNGDVRTQNTSDLAIYEQYRLQGNAGAAHRNGEVGNGTIEIPRQRSLIPPFESAEMRTLAESLSRDIIRGNPEVKWDSIKGLETAKRLLKEAVVMPIKYPKSVDLTILGATI